MSGPAISVVICTRNREHCLATAMQSVVDQTVAPDRFELIVVDNASTDRTSETVRRFTSHPNVRYEFEGEPGLCRARNTGWQRARGRYVIYLDDDTVARPGWLQAALAGFALDPRIGVIGGRVDPIWKGARPSWLSDDVALSLTIVNWSEEPKWIDDLRREWVVGANMAVPRSVLEEVGGFEIGLDRVGTRMLSSGDVFLTKRILQRGYRCLYEPRMAVGHLVPQSRLTKAWFTRRYLAQGLSDAAMQLIEEAPSWPERLWHALGLAAGLGRSPHAVLNLLYASNDPRLFTERCLALITVGHIAGLLGAYAQK